MKAAMFFGSGDVRLQEVDIPKIGPDEVLVKVGTALTCGSDVKAFRQGHPVLLGDSYPAPFGHELAGTVVKVGRQVTSVVPGMRVVAANSAPCDRCFFCRRGQSNLCDHLQLLNGAYAEYIRIPSQIVKHNLYEIPENLSFKEAALSEPLACAVHAFKRLGMQAGDTAVILGCGIMGLLFSAVAKANNVRLIAIGRNQEKLERAELLGVDNTVDIRKEKDPVARARSLTPESHGADFVIEAIGQPEAWEQSLRLVRKGGTVCLFGGCARGSRFSLDTHQTHYQELTVRGIFHHTPIHFAEALEFLSRGLIKAEMFITSVVPLDAIGDYFYQAVHNRISHFKAAVIP